MKLKRKQVQAQVSSAAIGDIAFNLLIFFVILANAAQDDFVDWEPAKLEDLESFKSSKVSVAIDRTQTLYLNGTETSVSGLGDQIATLLGDAEPGNREVLLKVHKTTPAPVFEPVIEAISEAGGDLVHVLEQEQISP